MADRKLGTLAEWKRRAEAAEQLLLDASANANMLVKESTIQKRTLVDRAETAESALSQLQQAKDETEGAEQAVAQGEPKAILRDLVARFATALLSKLEAAEDKYGWENGWRKEGWESDLKREVVRHLYKGDPRDVAAYCAFAWHHGWTTIPESSIDTLAAIWQALGITPAETGGKSIVECVAEMVKERDQAHGLALQTHQQWLLFVGTPLDTEGWTKEYARVFDGHQRAEAAEASVAEMKRSLDGSEDNFQRMQEWKSLASDQMDRGDREKLRAETAESALSQLQQAKDEAEKDCEVWRKAGVKQEQRADRAEALNTDMLAALKVAEPYVDYAVNRYVAGRRGFESDRAGQIANRETVQAAIAKAEKERHDVG